MRRNKTLLIGTLQYMYRSVHHVNAFIKKISNTRYLDEIA